MASDYKLIAVDQDIEYAVDRVLIGHKSPHLAHDWSRNPYYKISVPVDGRNLILYDNFNSHFDLQHRVAPVSDA